MQFSTPKDKILNAVLIAERIVGKKESLPVLSCIVFDVGKEITIRATNLEAGVEIKIAGEIVEKGTLAVPASVVAQTLRAISGDKLTLKMEGQNLLVEARGSRTLIKAVPHDEFPTLSGKTDGTGIKLARVSILDAVHSVAYAASTSMIRPELGSIYLSVTDGKMLAVATDSFRLAEKSVSESSGGGSGDVLVPLKHAQELMHILERITGETVELFIDDAQLVVVADGLTFTSRIIDGNFPNYKEIIPKDASTEVTLLKSDFTETLRKARVFAGADQHVGFHVYPKKKVFDVMAQSAAIGEMSDSLEAALSGEDIDVNFHIGYVTDCLQSIQSDSITLRFSGAGRPLIIRGVSDTSFTYLVMPLNR